MSDATDAGGSTGATGSTGAADPAAPRPDDLRFHPTARALGPLPPLHAERLYATLGVERPLDEVARLLRHYVQGERPPAVGALLVTCADEAERECRDAFEHGFVRYLLPHMKFSARAEVHLANLGGRYEWGAARIAENHYADAPGASEWKLVLVKINAHVSVEDSDQGPIFGRGPRYENQSSIYCGALAATLDGDQRPFAHDLAEGLAFEDVDRLAALRNPARVDPSVRALFAAAASARQQARRAMIDVQDYAPQTPTMWIVVPCVTLNRPTKDAEILLGVYAADRRGGEPHDEWCGLGDHPERYRLTVDGTTIALDDPELARPRRARDHRAAAYERWRASGAHALDVRDARIAAALADALTRDDRRLPAALKSALALALETSPVPGAAALFAKGALGIHNARRAQRLARPAEAESTARTMLREIAGRLDALAPPEARRIAELLLTEYR